ncbi:MAG: acetate--CoA ligase family protein [Thermodesulfobacteriota bacterium]
MEKLFYPESIVIMGLSKKSSNVPRIILENLIRWGYMGRIFGVNPKSEEVHVDGVRMYTRIEDLPFVPDLCVALIPARLIPETVETCGRFGIRYMAIPSGGFNETGEEGQKLADVTMETARAHGVRFIGPNGLTVANTENGLCLPFIPLYSPPKGGLSVITQSGGLGLMLWNLMTNENVGMAKFASIGNKLDLTELDFLEYFARDPETKVIAMYLESITDGKKLVEMATRIDKPIVIFKSSTTGAGNKAAMSHTAAVSHDDAIIDTAFERAGIIRIHRFADFISMAKVFKLPPMRGNRLMVMSPAGGFTVILADLCEKAGFAFADPGTGFYEELQNYSNAGVINFSNPLDMGDIYDPAMYAQVFFSVLHNENVDGAVYLTQWPDMPRGEDLFTRMFNTDLSKEAIGALQSSGTPMGVCLYGNAKTTYKIKQNIAFPLFNNPEELIGAMKAQQAFYAKKERGPLEIGMPGDFDIAAVNAWLAGRTGTVGEAALKMIAHAGVPVAASRFSDTATDAAAAAEAIGYPVVVKVVSPDAVHKSDAGGVLVNRKSADSVADAFDQIRDNLRAYNKDAAFQGVRVMQMAPAGHDMFVGGKVDPVFGPVVVFGMGGIYVEVFADVQMVLCPSNREEIEAKVKRLKSYPILTGTRGQIAGDLAAFVDIVEHVSHLMAQCPEITELDLNPVRVLAEGEGALALDCRMQIQASHGSESA